MRLALQAVLIKDFGILGGTGVSEVTYFRTKHFDRALKAAKFGGPSRKAATKVSAVLGSLGDKDPFAGLNLTNHGETRIPKCLKYNLGDGWRLVTVQDSRTCGFIFVGDHDEVDRFLDQHCGTRFGVRDGNLVSVPGASLSDSVEGANIHMNGVTSRLIELLGVYEDYVLQDLSHHALRKIDRLDSNSTAAEIRAAVVDIAELDGRGDTTTEELLAIRLVWEEALFNAHHDAVAERWAEVVKAHALPMAATAEDVIDAILQEATERAEQRRLAHTLISTGNTAKNDRPVLQAAFCIDVRSEVYRRALESVDARIQTIGFAGFFGLTASHRRFASDIDELRLPVLLNPGIHSRTGTDRDVSADRDARIKSRAHRAWGRFKLAAVSSFAFVEAAGPIYVGKLLGDSFNRRPLPAPHDPAPKIEPALDLSAKIDAADNILRAMSLTDNFAPVVVLAGHGANVVNNPHSSALHCGACGGYSGEVNARLVATLFNNVDVRAGLALRNIHVPSDTVFVAALHDTTTDTVTVYDGDVVNSPAGLRDIRRWFDKARILTSTERALRLPGAINGTALAQRSRDWAEVRPEWALAGCSSFIAAPRQRTAGKALGGRAFLHDYDWRADSGFKVLELILTAPVVVASWISLQYYGSTVAPAVFGGGNKLIHNVVGGLGVVEGNGGALRTGLPWQSVHDGTDFVHDPLRLTVVVEAPREAIIDILTRHTGVRALFDNHWLHLLVLNDQGQPEFRYDSGLSWTGFDESHPTKSDPIVLVPA